MKRWTTWWASFSAFCAFGALGHPRLGLLAAALLGVVFGWPERTGLPRPGPVPDTARAEVYARDGMTCQYCERAVHPACGRGRGPFGLCPTCASVDHVIPRSRGGPATVGNLVCACWQCNAEKSARTPREWTKAGTWFG